MARFSQPDPSRATRRTVLTALVAVIVISFAIAAVAGITVLLIGGLEWTRRLLAIEGVLLT